MTKAVEQMRRWIVRAGVVVTTVLTVVAPATASADPIDVQLSQLQGIAAQWWADYGLTADMPYAAGGYAIESGCGDTVRILREHIDDLGDVSWPHGCDIHLSETLVRAAFTAHPPLGRPATLRYAITNAGLRPRGRYAARELLCAVMVHEYGHILGLPHAPSGIMQSKAPAPPPMCVAWARG